MYSDWDQKNEIRRSPEDRDSLSAWLTDANDDAGNARPAFIASKNVFLPEQKEIDSLELYIGKYLWGGMQMTDKEKYPYAIYGIPNWKANRASADEGRNGQAHVWRIYDYPHIVMLYYRMYQIAKFYPTKVKYLDAAGYLERAYRTAIAYWTVPKAVEKWSADAVGTMNEAFIPELIDALEKEGKADWAQDAARALGRQGRSLRQSDAEPLRIRVRVRLDGLRVDWRVRALCQHAPALSQAVHAGRGEEVHRLPAVARTWPTAAGSRRPTTSWGATTAASLTYLLSYMSQMGGWAILDYGLHFAADPTDYLRLGYASSLSSWALVNSGTQESGYGYWFPSTNNDGADRRRVHAGAARPRVDRQADGARRVVLQRRGRRRLLPARSGRTPRSSRAIRRSARSPTAACSRARARASR